jgi:hypothetical protein
MTLKCIWFQYGGLFFYQVSVRQFGATGLNIDNLPSAANLAAQKLIAVHPRHCFHCAYILDALREPSVGTDNAAPAPAYPFAEQKVKIL